MALHSGAIYHRAVPSFHLLSSPMVAPTDGTAPSGSRAKDKQPARTPQSNAPDPGATPTPPFPTPSSTEQRIASFEAQLSSLLATMQQVQQAILQATPQQQMQPQQHQPFPPQELPPQHLPPPSTLQSNAFVPPISLNPASGMSLDRSFPHVDPALRLAIAKHEFRPGHLYKLDAIVKGKPTAKAFEISDDGAFTQRERDASPKDYPSFCTLFDPLVIYFEILQFFIISSGNVAAIHQVNLGCSEYLCILYQIYSHYEWSVVLQYHFMFHNHHLAEMCNGDYSGWQVMDSELASLYLYGNPKANPPHTQIHRPPLMQNKSALHSKVPSALHPAPMAASINAKFAAALTMGARPAPTNQSQLHRTPAGRAGSCHFGPPLVLTRRTSPTGLIPVPTISPFPMLPLTSQSTPTCCRTLSSFLLALPPPLTLTLTRAVILSPHPQQIFPAYSPI